MLKACGGVTCNCRDVAGESLRTHETTTALRPAAQRRHGTGGVSTASASQPRPVSVRSVQAIAWTVSVRPVPGTACISTASASHGVCHYGQCHFVLYFKDMHCLGPIYFWVSTVFFVYNTLTSVLSSIALPCSVHVDIAYSQLFPALSRWHTVQMNRYRKTFVEQNKIGKAV